MADVEADAAQTREIIRDHLGVEADEVVDTANLVDDLGADSLDLVEVTMAIEDGFPGVKVDDVESEKCRTVGDWVALVASKRA